MQKVDIISLLKAKLKKPTKYYKNILNHHVRVIFFN